MTTTWCDRDLSLLMQLPGWARGQSSAVLGLLWGPYYKNYVL